MTITIRPSADRGHGRLDWLDSRHTFSFADYHDPRHMGLGALRVINEDRVAPGGGFDTHGHRDMEIVTYVLDGALEHRDNLGNGSVIRAGDVQRMTAGRGIMHSEFNHSASEPVHFFQIWIVPDRTGLEPGYEQRAFPAADRQGRLCLVAGRGGRDGALTLHQDADLHAALLAPGDQVDHGLAEGRRAWLQIARGAVDLNGHELSTVDGAAVSAGGNLRITAATDAEILLFDLG